jgi:hypothetical protein
VTAVYALDSTPRNTAAHDAVDDRDSLEQQIRGLRERLAFYEGFDLLIQDNVAQARELFRLASMEREAATSAAERARRESHQREAALRLELEAVAAELADLGSAVNALSQRVAVALGEPANGWVAPRAAHTAQSMAVVVHGVPSARTALSLQRFVASLPQVSDVSAREFAGGVLRLDASVRERLLIEQFRDWDDPRRIQPLTERPDVIELALHAPDAIASLAGV